MSARVPLLLQPANPPLPFVGRAAESARLVAVIERGPVAIVCGMSGVGKSGLLAATLATHFADARERTIVVDTRENTDVIARALRDVASTSDKSAPTRSGARDLIEALEADALWLLLENLERIDESVLELLALAQRFCRRARVLCVCREDPRRATLAPHTVAIGPMSTGELRALLEEIEPGIPDSEANGIVAHAKGSPWRLRQLSLGGVVDDEGPEKSLLMLAPIAVGLLRTLSLMPSSVPSEVLARATRLPGSDAVESLARRGYLEIGARGMRLHDAARPLVDALFEHDERAARAQKLARAIADTGSPELCLAALALVCEAHDAPALLAILEKHGAALCAAGHAPALLAALDVVDTHAPRDIRDASNDLHALSRWACRLTLDVGGDALARFAIDEAGADPSMRSWHAAILFARGELALACAAALRAIEDVRADKAASAAHVRMRALAVLIRSHDDDDDDASDRALLQRALKDPHANPADRLWALALAADAADRDLARAFAALAPSDRIALAAIIARALLDDDDDPRGAYAVLASVGATLATADGRASEIERGRVALALADLDDARAHFERSYTTPLEQSHARLGVLAVRVAVGDLRGVDAELAAVVAVLQEGESPRAIASALASLTASLALLAGKGRARALPSLDEARKARARARDAGLALAALEATVVCIDSAIVAGARADIAVEAEPLAQASERIGSRRFALHARFAELVATGALSSTALVELAQATHECPVVARRARALLGESVALDDVDRAVLATLSAHAARPQATALANQSAGPEWTVDAAKMCIILVDGRTVDLSHKQVLFDLLAALCASGGAASKEQLLERAWGVRDYHPLRHDNRLKVAVRKLRRLLEEILGDDPIESAADGYRLRGKVRFLK